MAQPFIRKRIQQDKRSLMPEPRMDTPASTTRKSVRPVLHTVGYYFG